MELFDIVEDMAEKQAMKTDTGDNRMFGVTLAQVAKNYDQQMPGRVCVTVPTRDKNANELKWARVLMPSGGSSWGQYFIPEVGDQVLLAFEQGNIERPYVLGCIPKDSDKILTESKDENNQKKRIVTKNGSSLTFEDNKEGTGEKDKITLETAQQMHSLTMDNENDYVLLTDKEKKNQVKIDTKNGKLELTVEKEMSIKVGENIEIKFDGSSGGITIKATKCEETLSGDYSLKANSSLKLSGSTVETSANGSLKLSSSGTVTISGTPIKIG